MTLQVTCPAGSVTGITGATSDIPATTSNSAVGTDPATYQQASCARATLSNACYVAASAGIVNHVVHKARLKT
jgi:hypothetical protein